VRSVDETVPPRPARYNRSVLQAESNVAKLATHGSIGVVLRFGYFYGPGDPNTLQLLRSIRGGWYPMFGRSEGYTSWLHLDDAAAAVVAALEVPGGIYNVVEDIPTRRRELANGLASLLGVRPPRLLPAWTTALAGSVGETLARSIRISNRRFKAESGWTPGFADAVKGMGAVLAAEGGRER
jgi:nucleoside-diphosphate-sugar epimerase